MSLKLLPVVKSTQSVKLFWDPAERILVGHDNLSDSSWRIRSLYSVSTSYFVCNDACGFFAGFYDIISPEVGGYLKICKSYGQPMEKGNYADHEESSPVNHPLIMNGALLS